MDTGHAIPLPYSHFTPPPVPGLAREWEHVRVERVEVERALPPATLARVQACLFLGRLLPVDVEAELVTEPVDDAAVGDTTSERLWSSHSYQNGSYLFEAHVPDERLAAARRVRIRVRPRDRLLGDRSLSTSVPPEEPARAPTAEDVVPLLPSTRDDLGP